MRVGDLGAGRPHPADGLADRAPRAAPPEHEQLGVGVALDLDRRDVVGDAGHLVGPEVDHQLVVVGVVVDVAGAVLLLDAADAVHQAGRAGDGPRPGQRLRVAQVGPELGPSSWLGSVANGTEMSGSASTSGSCHGSEPLAR